MNELSPADKKKSSLAPVVGVVTEAAVYHFDYDNMTVDKLPDHYNAGWRHVESVDPALRSQCGYTLWAEDPRSGIWYLVNDKYITGPKYSNPQELYELVQKRSQPYNIVRRISDTMAWYTSVASKNGTTYMTPYDRNSRKEELIKSLQSALSSNKVKIGRWCGTFIDEIQGCQRSETGTRSYRTMDCAQYFCDAMPPFDSSKTAQPWQS